MLAGGRSSFVIRVVIVRSKMKLQRVDYFKVGLLKDSSVRLLSSKGPKHQQKVSINHILSINTLYQPLTLPTIYNM